MKAAVYYGRRDVRVEEVPDPTVGPGTVKVRVEWCGICGTDLHEYVAGPIFIPAPDNPHPLTGQTMPVILGHEFAGTVVEVGPGVTRARVGDRVAVEPILICHECPECRRGTYNLCRKLGFLGLSGLGGGFAEFTVVPEYLVHKLPDGMTTEEGALVEPVAVGFHAVRKAGFLAGQTALVLGAGPIGLVTVQCLRAAGASLVAVAEVAAARKEMALRVGADVVIDPTEEDVVATVHRLTHGVGVDVAFDAAGLVNTLRTAIAATARGGTVVNIAIWEGPVELNMNDLVFAEVKVMGVLAYAHEFPSTIALMKDRIRVTPLITRKIRLTDIVRHGFEELLSHKDRHVKILVQP